MLNPEQVKRLKAQVIQDPRLTSFEGRYIKSVTISVNPSASDVRAPESFGVILTPPALIMGNPIVPDCLNGVLERRYEVPKPEFRTIDRGRIIGNTAVLSPDNHLYWPDDINLASKDQLTFASNVSHQGFALINGSSPEEWKICHLSRKLPLHYSHSALFLHNLEPANYGSFIFRQLPQILYAVEAGYQFDCIVVSARTSWLLEVLYLVGLGQFPVFSAGEVVGDTFDKISFFNQFDAEGMLSPETRTLLKAFVDKTLPLGSGKNKGKNIYVSRALTALTRPHYRQMLNENEVEEKFRTAGFDIIYPEVFGFREQLAVFAEAKKIFGPSGSGLFNCAFSGPNAKIVDVETYNVSVRLRAKLYSSSGNLYSFGFVTPDELDESPLMRRQWNMPMSVVEMSLDWLNG